MNSSSPAPWEPFKKLFVLDYKSVEEEVEDKPGQYKDLDPRALYTPLEDFYKIMTSPFCGGTWVDLGSGIGESVLMYGRLFPQRRAIGVESSLARVKAGRELKERLELSNIELREGDLLNCDFPEGETYFLYFPTGHVLDRILSQLKRIKFSFLIVIESHGDLLPRLRKENWLRVVEELPLSTPRHHSSAVIFSKEENAGSSGLHDVSFLERYLLIHDQDGEWIGESFGLEWIGGDKFHLATPPRTFEARQVVHVGDIHDLTSKTQMAFYLRREGELMFFTRAGNVQGFIRKIQVRPAFRLELSCGQWIQWEDILSIQSSDILCYESS